MSRILTTVALVALASQAARASGPVCALLDPEKVPRVALLEAKLLADPNTTWVERATIDRVLKEQKLQAAFGPQGVRDRVQLGKLLKADVLVMIRPGRDPKEPVLEIVVSETKGGLRLLVRAVPVTREAQADVAALQAAVHDGINKHGAQVREVIALPPFVSNNLGYEFDHLRGAYAKLAEQAALAQPGVVAVELAEAEALAREIKLADPGTTLQRPEPLYLLGEFRHQGRGADLKVALKLRAARGGKPVGEPAEKVVAPEAVPATLQKWVADQIHTGGKEPRQAADPKIEAKQLADLAQSCRRLGDWAESLALLDASLLLDHKQPELNADAMAVIRLRIAQILGREPKKLDRLRQAAPLHHRGLEHMEALITSGAKLPRFEGPHGVRSGRFFYSAFPLPQRLDPYGFNMAPPPPDPAPVQEIIHEVAKEQRAVGLRLVPVVVNSGTSHEVAAIVRMAVGEVPGAQRYAEYGRLLLEFQDRLAVTAAADFLLHISAYNLSPDELPAYHKLLDKLDKEADAGVKAAVARARQRLPEVEKQMRKLTAEAAENKGLFEQTNKNPPKLVLPIRLTREERANRVDERLQAGPFRQVRLAVESPEDDWFLEQVQGVIAAGPGVDVFWATGYFFPPRPKDTRTRAGFGSGKAGPALLVMKHKGQLRRVWEQVAAPEKFSSVCFDGRYVWAATEGQRQPPALFVFDPIAEKCFEVTAADGLPQPPEDMARDPRRLRKLTLLLTPLEAGRVCVVGSFGRAWVGIAKFDPSAKKASVKVIHEARELPQQDEKEKDLWQNPRLAFTPMYAHTLRGSPGKDGKTPLRVLIGRATSLTAIQFNDASVQSALHPLVIDPDGPAVEVMHDTLFGFAVRDTAVAVDGALLVADHPPTMPGTVRLLRVEYPGVVRNLGPLDIKKASTPWRCGVIDDRLYFAFDNGTPVQQPGGGKFVGSACWSVNLDGKDLRKVVDDMLHVRAFARSSHYGPVVWCDLYPGFALCEVKTPRK